MKTLYIHIGSAKTATSSIQDSLFKNKKYLKEQGLLYPDSPTFPDMSAQHDVTFSVAGEPCSWLGKPEVLASERPVRSLIKKIESTECDKIIISSETFFDVLKEVKQINNLKNWFNNYEIKIIIYLRRYDDYFISMAEHDERVSSPYAPAVINVPEVIKSLSPYGTKLDKWAEVFGVDNLIVRPFNRNVFKNGNIIDDLLGIVGVEKTDDYIKTSSVNESLSFQRYELLRRMRAKLDIEQSGDYDQKARHKVIENLPDDILNRGKGKDILNYDQRERILNHFEEDHQYLIKRYWQEDKEFFEKLDKSVYDEEDVELEQKDLLALIDFLCELIYANGILNKSPFVDKNA